MAESDVEAYVAEDSVTFLQRIQELCPVVLSLVSPKQAKLLSRADNEVYEPKDVNEEYLSDMKCCLSMQNRVEEAEIRLRDTLLKPCKVDREIDVESFKKQTEVLKMVEKRMKHIIEGRLRCTEEQKGEPSLPRIIRLCRKFKFTEEESRITIYLLFIQSNTKVGAAKFTDVLSAYGFLKMPLKIILDFLDKDRLHIQQGIFPEVDESYIFICILRFDPDFFKALMGYKLKSNEFLKLEQTPLADVIAEEPGNEHYRNEGADMKGLVSPDLTKESEEEKEKEEEEEEALVEPPEMDPMAVGIPDQSEELQVTSADPPKDDVLEVKEEAADLETLLRQEREREKARHEKDLPVEPEGEEPDDDPDKLKPYKKDLEYLDDHFKLITLKLKVKAVDLKIEDEEEYENQRFLKQKREAESKVKIKEKRCAKRLALTKQSGSWMPRLERMVQSRNLCEFEKSVLLTLIASVIQPNIFQSFDVRIISNDVQAGELIRIFCADLEEQIHQRKYFYKSASLVHEGMIVVNNSGLTGDPTSATVEIDRRMLDFCVGLDTEFSEIVEGSHLYFPKTKFEQVILPKDQKQLILNTVSNFEAYKRCRKKMGLDDAITYGAGMVMLFHGPPGTGKTMMANALANKLTKKVLLINFPSLGTMSAGENFKFIFREAKINDAILFFDECESIFESREHGGRQVNLLLTEIERHDGLIVLATNRPYDLDEAMHRRIMIAIEFRQPDHLLRKSIWESHMPEQMTLSEDINLDELSLRFELTGGFIKNAILSALSIAVARDGESPVVCQKDLLQGANLQLRGRLRMKDFDRRVVPVAGLDEVIVEESVMKQLREIVQFEKARAVLFGQWGFAKRNHQGLTILLHGPPGTGKTMAAESIGYEVGKPLKVINCGELLSKWVGESTKNIDAIFQEARHQDAILVFDEAEGLFGQRTEMSTSTDRYANVDVGVLLYHIERFPGIIILTTNLFENIDKAFFRRLRFVLHLDIPPEKFRGKLWKLIIPEEAPLADDVNFEELAHYEMTGGSIKSAVFRAASRAALRREEDRKITMKDLEESAKEEVGKSSSRIGFRRQDSEAARMYN